MPRYLFHVLTADGRRIEDNDGSDLPMDEDAREYAARVIDELKRDEPNEFMGYSLELREGNRFIAVLPFYGPN
jgi:hypothetical protein